MINLDKIRRNANDIPKIVGVVNGIPLDYNVIVTPFLLVEDIVTITQDQVNLIDDFIERVFNKKREERIHQSDGDSEDIRWETGTGGEMAVENLLGRKFVDLSVGKSKDYDKPDLISIGLNAGIKTVRYGKLPVIHLNPKIPEIIVVKKSTYEFYICGLATIEVQKEYQNIDFILDPKLKARKDKTAFYGFDKLISFKSYEELKNLASI